MKKDKDTVCPILFTFTDATPIKILSCLSKVHTVQIKFLAALSKNLLGEEWKFLCHLRNLVCQTEVILHKLIHANAIPDTNNKS